LTALAMPLLFGMPTSAGFTLQTTTARDMHSARSLLKPWGGSVLGPCSFSAKPPAPRSPSQGTSVPSVTPMCAASCSLCSVMYLVCSPLQQASTPHAQVPAGSGAHRCPHQRFRTRRAGAIAGFVGGVLVLIGCCCLLLCYARMSASL
jgi:hypothetical protein